MHIQTTNSTTGAQIATAVHVFDQYAILASFGAGLDYCVGGGVLIHIGTAVNQYSGPVNSVRLWPLRIFFSFDAHHTDWP